MPTVLTYHSAKGLTFECVFLPSITWDAFSHDPQPDELKRLFFVALTRATAWVCASCVEKDMHPLVDDIVDDAADLGVEVSREWSPTSPAGRRPSRATVTPEDDLDGLF